MSRVVPTEPGWWWGRINGEEAPRRVMMSRGGLVVVSSGFVVGPVEDKGWTWFGPVATPEEVATLRADLQRIHVEAWQRMHNIDRLRADLELATLEVEALRQQVAELLANGVSMHKAADRAAKAERAAIVAWLRREYFHGDDTCGCSADTCVDYIERGDHEVPR